MKRTNVVLDEELLEKARRVTGERTYSAAITTALQEVVRVAELAAAIGELQELARQGVNVFHPSFLAEQKPRGRVAAHEKRLPRKGSGRAARRK